MEYSSPSVGFSYTIKQAEAVMFGNHYFFKVTYEAVLPHNLTKISRLNSIGEQVKAVSVAFVSKDQMLQ